MAYTVRLQQFEGPLDLLLELIEKEKLDITEISLASVAEQYLEYLNNLQNISPGVLVNFLTVASKLILIKSRSILPTLEISEEEEEEIQDLKKQLEEYKKFKDASKIIGKIVGKNEISYSRESFFGIQTFFYPPKNINSNDLRIFFKQVLKRLPVVEKLSEETVREVITLQEKIKDLQKNLAKKAKLNFETTLKDASSKTDIIVSFLAILELSKQRIIWIEQREMFGKITLNKITSEESKFKD